MAKVGVVGAGVMGIGVAQNLAQYDHSVVLVDKSPEALNKALDTIRLNSRMSQMLGGPALNPDKILAAISGSTELSALSNVEILIENITENWDLKKALYAELDKVCQPDTIFVANTSAIPITKLAALTSRPQQFAGVHFMNPVPMKPAVELIPGHHTSDSTVEKVRELLSSIDKKSIPVNDACGFVSNRVLMLTVNEAAFLVYENVADAKTVDEVFRSCFGHPMGPLETADLIGIDTILYSIEVLYEHFADSKYRPCPLLKHMTEAGLHGRKSGEGFYKYQSLLNPLSSSGSSPSNETKTSQTKAESNETVSNKEKVLSVD